MKKSIICVASDTSQLAALGREGVTALLANVTTKIVFSGDAAATEYVRPLIGATSTNQAKS